MDNLITSYFSSVPKHKKKAKRRSSAAFGEVAEPDRPSSATKKSKLSRESSAQSSSEQDTRKERGSKKKKQGTRSSSTPGASSSKQVPASGASSNDKSEVAYISLLDSPPKAGQSESGHAFSSSLPQGTVNTRPSRQTRAHKQDSVVPPTPEHERHLPQSSMAATPIILRGLTQTWSDETVGSSQSQEEEEEYGGPSYSYDTFNLASRASFTTPRKNKASRLERSGQEEHADSEDEVVAAVTPKRIHMSQSQRLSVTQSATTESLRPKATLFIEESLELVPSSQSQEKELDVTVEMSQRVGWYIGSQIENLVRTPEPKHGSPLKRQVSLTKELPMRHMSLREEGDTGLLVNINDQDERPIPLEESQTQSQESNPSPYVPEVMSITQTYESPNESQRVASFPQLSQHSPLAARLFQNPASPSPIHRPATPPIPEIESQTQSECSPLLSPVLPPSQADPSSLPPEVKAFQEMFQGEESYPDDFPMSLRI